MKFVCDNCKAKYQIGDDKVAGKTVRMKCRKCGYNIKVTPAPPDGSPMEAPGTEAEAPLSMEQPVAAIPAPAPSGLRATAPAPARPGVPAAPRIVPAPPPSAPVAQAAPLAAQAPWTEGDDENTSIMSAPVRDAVLAATGHTAPRPGAPRPVTAAAPRPVTAAPVRPAAPSRTVPGVAPQAPARPVTRSVSTQSLAAVAAPEVSEPEWYVGIGGTPIGPVRVAVIRERAAAHEVDGDSLVWREGMGEWKPLRAIPELLEVVTAAQAPRPAPTPTPLAAAPAPVAAAPAPVTPAPAPAVAPAPVVQAPLAAAPALTPAPPAPAAPAPVAAAPIVVGDPFAKPAPTPAPAPSPFGESPLVTPSAPAPNGKANGIHHPAGLDVVAAVPAAAPVATPLPQSAPDPAPSAPKVSTVDIDAALEQKLVPRRGNTHPMAYAFIAAAMVFAGVAAYVLLVKPPPPKEKEIVYVTVPGAPTVVPSAAPDDKSQPQVDVGELTTAASGRPRLGGPMPKSTASAVAVAPGTSAPIDTSGFVSNVPGPAAVAPVGPAPGGALSASEIQGVVSSQQAMMRRKCWQPAMESAAPTAGSSARVSSSITIGPSGAVESSTATGAEKDYPGLSACIADRIKHWKFPPPGGSQTVNVPFNFIRQ